MVAGRPFGIVGTLLPLLCLSVPAPSAAQSACSYAISLTGDIGDLGDSSQLLFTSWRGASHVRLIAPSGCPWTAESSASFVTLQPTSGFGTTDVSFSVEANLTSNARRATLRIADQFVTVTQGRGVPIVDFDRDGHFDLLWHNRADGRIATWLMNGSRLRNGAPFTTSQVSDTNWELAGSGDLNGDGHSDLVWQNKADGRIAAWLMAGMQKMDAALLSVPQVADLNWRVRAVTDVNGDGRADIFWQHQTQGLVAVWLMNGLNVLDGSLVRAPVITDLEWRLVGVSGGLDSGSVYGWGSRLNDALILHWQHDGDGRLAVWYVSRMEIVTGGLTGSTVSDTNWKVRAMGDLDRDGEADYIWHHQVDGRLGVWLTRRSWQTVELGAVPDRNWQLVGPR